MPSLTRPSGRCLKIESKFDFLRTASATYNVEPVGLETWILRQRRPDGKNHDKLVWRGFVPSGSLQEIQPVTQWRAVRIRDIFFMERMCSIDGACRFVYIGRAIPRTWRTVEWMMM